jgi:GDP-4-dehydro-6-deoxy-D-mannose reductase
LHTLPNVEVHAFKRWRSDTRPIAHLLDRVAMHEGDIEDPFSLSAAIRIARPDRVYHLAAQSYPSASWAAPIATMRANVEGTIHLLEAVRANAPNARVHIAGTSAQYGPVRPEDTPIPETHPMRPQSPYGVSKVAAELSGLQYHASYGLHVVVTRSFNHVGPHQHDRTALQSFCRQMVAIEAGQQPPRLLVGNLAPRRDFSHTRDVARALHLLLEHAPPGEVYNLCSGVATQIGTIVELVRERGRVPVEVVVDETRLRPVDEPILVGDVAKLQAATGWRCTIDMAAIVDELLTYWRARMASDNANSHR